MKVPLVLDIRGGPPEVLGDLLQAYRRAGWPVDPNFEGLVRFRLVRRR